MAHGDRSAWLSTKLREYWSRRGPPGGCARGSWAKRWTHRKERRDARRQEAAAKRENHDGDR